MCIRDRTVYSAVLFGLAAVWGGVTVAVVMSVLTSQKGLLGLPAFLCSMAPQGVCLSLIHISTHS